MLLKSKQRDKIIKLRNHLEQKGWSISEKVADVGNDILRWGDVPGNILVSWELTRGQRYKPLHLDFEANDDGLGMVISKDDFWQCSLRESTGESQWRIGKNWDENINSILQSLNKIHAEQSH